MNEWIDISVPLRTGMGHWPGDIPVSIRQTANIKKGDVANVRVLSLSAHTGTHMDAPLHFIDDGESIDRMPFDATIGPARVIAITNEQFITRAELEPHDPQPGERLLFKTANSSRSWQNCRYFLKQFVHIRAEAATFLASRKVRTIGIDYLSIGGYDTDGVETHQILLGAGVWAIEGLDLSNVEPGEYDLVCLPLKVAGGDGAPSRAIVRKR